MRVAPKNRNSSKRKTQRQGLSGNPQRRADQLERDRLARPARPEQPGPGPLSGMGASSLRDLAYLLAGGAEEAPWWRDSHERVLQKARALDWPSRLSDIEDQACELIGGQFYDNLEAHEGGHHQAQWLRALAEYAGTALRAAIADGGDWQQLWTLLYGIALTAPESATADQSAGLREEFPGIKDPYATAVAELEQAATLLSSSERSEVTPLTLPVPEARPAGVPLVARDAYGSRFLVAAPFAYESGVPDHWYAWDIDACWVVSVVGAGTFASADAALAEWRGAVGAAADSDLSPGDPAAWSPGCSAPACRPGHSRTCSRGTSRGSSSASCTGCGAAPAPSPGRSPTGRRPGPDRRPGRRRRSRPGTAPGTPMPRGESPPPRK